ncbi:hypothetical protein KAFR_0G02990 [Kazachstania africana CBS 2517]|uniref:Uncharacterized protein n=1 Tax=Kazachstania africana (strain ATCC 22294 / BCRC 22015 / CBS 2517 / CECT 1963 / NBRC 1671 / NRRL Y-8276) TaxID=1071382 RepID=H2AY81_KAZAF|nr:hypothetical protein KAFR_0G02990 [Kazachstania africana CBS 2517]CCF59331.1 hypothetical protein KAFR_0G02990 [Kazachstania africana CBS 2517]
MSTAGIHINNNLAIPDTRFGYVFRKAVQKELRKQVKETDSDNKHINKNLIICKVIARDVILMPFIQSILWTGFLISFKPCLRGFIRFCQRLGPMIKGSILEGNIGKSKTL